MARPRGQLDKLTALSTRPAPVTVQTDQPQAATSPNYPAQVPQDYGKRSDFYDSDFGKHQGVFRKKSWLKGIFE